MLSITAADGQPVRVGLYLHVRVRFTIILGLGVSRLLSGVAKLCTRIRRDAHFRLLSEER